MKVKSIKTIYLSEGELKEAIYNWLLSRDRHDLATHLKDNLCTFDWSFEEQKTYLAVDMDGTFDEEKKS